MGTARNGRQTYERLLGAAASVATSVERGPGSHNLLVVYVLAAILAHVRLVTQIAAA